MGIVSTLTLAERRAGALEDKERRKKVAKKLLRCGIAWEALCGVRYRYRDQLWPLALLGGLFVAGVVAERAQPLPVAAVAVLGAAVVVFHLRRKLTRRAEWTYAACCLFAAGGWLVATAATDARWVNVAGVLAWAVLSLRWWLHHEVRGWPGHSKSPLVNLWNEHVRDLQGGPLAGAEIDHPVRFEHGNSYTVHLVKGKQNLGKAMAALPLLETALDTPMEMMVIERHPDYPKNPSKLRLQEITRSPIEKTVHFDRPRHEDGKILLGPYADGIGEAFLRLYTENSMWSTCMIGGTGIGKTTGMDTIAISALDMRTVGQHTVLFYMDGQNGASSPILFKHATWAVGTDGALRMLGALERIADFRQKQNRANGWVGFTPSEDRPGILVLIDEAHLILPLAALRFANAAKAWRKLGIGFLVADQDSSLKTFGGEDSLRAALLGGTGLVMNVSSRIAGNLIPGLEVNPFDLPRISGYAVLVAAMGSGGRTAPYRFRYSPSAKDQAKAEAEGRKLPVPTIEEWFERYEPLEIDKGARRAAGRDYTRRHEVAEKEREELLAFVNADDATVVDLELENLPAAAAPESNGAGLTCAQRILALDWARYGEMERAQIFGELPDVNNSTVTKALQALVGDGSLERSDRGVYRRKVRG